MSETSIETVVAGTLKDPLSQSSSLGFSIGSISSSRRENSLISRTYKQASSLFLTRRLPEALSAIEPLITVPFLDEELTDDEIAVAPIVNASRSLRIKVWSLYLTLLNSIIELGPADGKIAFGGQVWRSIRDKARDGSIWDEVVHVGYGGAEEKVDADVVVNLATILLSHSPSQASNQQHVESYLAAPSELILESSDPLEQNSSNSHVHDSIHNEGIANTPRDLATRIKILDLYTLHILPRNEEWEYAREFIKMSEVLDEERQEAFLQTLQSLQDETTKGYKSEAPPFKKQTQSPEPEQKETKSDKAGQSAAPKSPPPTPNPYIHPPKKPQSEKDYGIDAPRRDQNPKSLSKTSPPRPGLYKRSLHLLSALHQLLLATTSSLSRNPLAALRLVLFVAALIAAFSRRGVQDRVGRAWDKVRRTVGMGVKVSYI